MRFIIMRTTLFPPSVQKALVEIGFSMILRHTCRSLAMASTTDSIKTAVEQVICKVKAAAESGNRTRVVRLKLLSC